MKDKLDHFFLFYFGNYTYYTKIEEVRSDKKLMRLKELFLEKLSDEEIHKFFDILFDEGMNAAEDSNPKIPFIFKELENEG